MAYNNFTVQQVFKNHNVNVLCNRIYDALIKEFTAPTIEGAFCITGTVAKIIQGASLSDILVIPFITDDKQIFKFCGEQLPKLLQANAVKLTDRVQMQYKGTYFEFHYISSITTIDTVTTLQVQDESEIPANIN